MLLITGGLLAKELVNWRIATRDACGFYLPLAQKCAAGDFYAGQHPIIPPLYPMVSGVLSRCFNEPSPGIGGLQAVEKASLIVSAVSMLVLVVVVFFIAAKVFNLSVAIGASALTAANPYLNRFGSEVGPETFYAVWLALALLAVLCYRARPGISWAVAAGLAAGLGALTRSEGIFLPVLGAIFVLIFGLQNMQAPSGNRWPRGLLHVAILLAVVLAVWWPRLSYIHQATGYYVLDVRLISHLPGANAAALEPLYLMPNELAVVNLDPPEPGTLSKLLDDAQQNLLMTVGPLTWVLAAIWLFAGRRVAGWRSAQVLILLVLLVEVLMVGMVKVTDRYIATIAAPAQIWGGLGLWTFAQRLHAAKAPWAKRMGTSTRMQLASMLALVAGLSIWSLLAPNAGSRNAELRTIGETVLGQCGPGAVLVADSIEPTYYGQAKAVIVRASDKSSAEISEAQLCEMCEKYQASCIVLTWDDKWCPWLLELAQGSGGSDFRIAGPGRPVEYVCSASAFVIPGAPSTKETLAGPWQKMAYLVRIHMTARPTTTTSAAP